MKKQNKDREEFMNCFMWSPKDNCWKLLPRRTPERIWEIIVETYTQKKVEDEREKVLEEVREIIKNKSGIPIFFKKEDDMSENNPHFKAICYYLNKLRQELLSKINNLKNNDSKGEKEIS